MYPMKKDGRKSDSSKQWSAQINQKDYAKFSFGSKPNAIPNQSQPIKNDLCTDTHFWEPIYGTVIW